MTPVLKVTMGLGAVIVIAVAGLLLVPMLKQTPTATSRTDVKITFDGAAAGQGKQLFTTKYACTACHSISSLKITGAAVGPDLSRVLLAQVPAGQNPVIKFMEEKGLASPETNPARASEILVEFLKEPPDYSTLMKGQVVRFKAAAGGENAWLSDVKSIVELFKQAVSEGSGR